MIGGGIAGLAAAHRLVELDPRCELTLFEAGPRLGGVLSTVHEDGFQVEQSADNFITTVPWGIESLPAARAGRPACADQSGLPADVRGAPGTLASAARRLPDDGPHAALAAGGHADPQSAGQAPRGVGVLHSAARGRRRREHGGVRPPPAGPRGVRPAGRAAGQRGLCGRSGEAQRVGHAAAFPGDGARLRQPDPGDAAPDGRAGPTVAASESGARYSMFVTLRDGLSSLVEAIASRLPRGGAAEHTSHADRTLRRCWRVWTEKGSGIREWGLGKATIS